jgi:hypothetical protein
MVEPKTTHAAHCSGSHIVRRDGVYECLLDDRNVGTLDVRTPYALAALSELEAAMHSTAYYGSTNVKATIAEAILTSAKAKVAEEARRDAAIATTTPASTEDSLLTARAMISEAHALNLRLNIQHENPLIRMLRGLVTQIETDMRKLAMAKNIVRDMEGQRDLARRDLAAAVKHIRELEASRDQARRAAQFIRSRVATITRTTKELDGFFGSSERALDENGS